MSYQSTLAATTPSTSLRNRVHDALHGRTETPGLTHSQKLSALAILASVILAIVGTEPALRTSYGSTFDATEKGFAALFIVEYLLRVWSIAKVPQFAGFSGRLRYMATPYALLDLLSILPFLAGWGAQSFLVRLLRLFRLLALSRLLQYSQAMRLVLKAILERRYELAFALTLSSCVILLSAAALYSAEAEANPEAFGSIPRALWWAVTTLTTVGYGDSIPTTSLGKFFAALTSIAGIGLIAMPTGILAAAFSQAFRDTGERSPS